MVLGAVHVDDRVLHQGDRHPERIGFDGLRAVLLYRIIGAETVAGIADKVPVLADSISRQDPVAVRALVLFRGSR